MADASGRTKVNKYQLYQVEGDKLVRTKKACPRCGQGVFLGKHADREVCGRCGYTETANAPSKEGQSTQAESKSEEKPAEQEVAAQ